MDDIERERYAAEHARIDKIAKLLRQSESAAGTPEEAAFQIRAFELMAKWGIDEAVARMAAEQTHGAPEKQASWIYLTTEGKYKPMQAHVIHMLAGAMQCKSLQMATMGRITCKVYGVDEHLHRLRIMWDILRPQLLRGLKNAEPPFGYTHSGELRVYRRNWVAGYASQIAERIRNQENAAAAAAGALVLYKSDANKAMDLFTKENPRTRQVGRGRQYDPSGWAHGTRDGKSASLNRSLV